MEQNEKIIGKYLVYLPGDKRHGMLTDNPREAVWEANKTPGKEIKNICGERNFYKENDKWHLI